MERLSQITTKTLAAAIRLKGNGASVLLLLRCPVCLQIADTGQRIFLLQLCMAGFRSFREGRRQTYGHDNIYWGAEL